MGTRADFYIREGKHLKPEDWKGSIAWDGYPDGIPASLKKATTKQGFTKALGAFLKKRDDATYPKEGWPWPWNNSGTTDYGYIFTGKKVVWGCFDHKTKWPDMSKLKNVQWGDKSGVMIIGMPEKQ
jgi:hypothetical protein